MWFREKILLNKFVIKIYYFDNSVIVIIVDGDEFIVDYVLLIFSFGVLGSGLVEFDFFFFKWKLEVIYCFCLVYFIKIFFKFL